jgi:hypothetical protein
MQDWILLVCYIIFTLALLPSVFGKDKPDLKTSGPTALVVLTFAITLCTLELYKAAAINFFTAACWIILFVQVWKQKKRKPTNN